MVTTPDLPPGRPIPDTDDLRLLAELVNNVSIPLANAAWNARMSQHEAATRLVDMAERGLPLRLVADGDRQVLWQITQAGPATHAVPVAALVGQQSPSVGAVPEPTPGREQPLAEPDESAAAGNSDPTATPGVAAEAMPAPPDLSAIPAQPAVSGSGGLPPVGPPPLPAAPAGPSTAPPAGLPPKPAVPPHEQAISGAVPLGRPPFGPSDAPPAPGVDVPSTVSPEDPDSPDGSDESDGPDSSDGSAQPTMAPEPVGATAADPVGSLWGVPGSSSWARTESTGAPAPADLPDLPAEVAESPGPPPTPSPTTDGPDASGLPAALPDLPAALPDFRGALPDPSAPPPDPSASLSDPAGGAAEAPELTGPTGQAAFSGVTGTASQDPGHFIAQDMSVPSADPGEPTQPWSPPKRWDGLGVTGPNGEQLLVTLLDVIDPGDEILAGAGFRMEPGERAILVHCSVANTGQIPYPFVPDLNLVLETDSRTLLGKAAIAVGSHPAFGVGVLPGRQGDGWSVFLVPSQTGIAAVKWCIRPDLPQTILSWSIEP